MRFDREQRVYGFALRNIVVINSQLPRIVKAYTLLHEFTHKILGFSNLAVEFVDKLDFVKWGKPNWKQDKQP